MTHFDNIEPPCVIKAHRLNVVDVVLLQINVTCQ
jgi:hypothetical protein